MLKAINYSKKDIHYYVMLLSVPVLLTLYRYQVYPEYFYAYFPQFTNQPDDDDLYARSWQFIIFFGLMFIIPVSNEPKAVNNAYIATDGLDITWHEFNTKLSEKLNVKLKASSIPFGIAMLAAKIYFGIHSVLNLKSEPFLTPYRINNGGMDYHFSIQKLKDHFSYKPVIDLDTALERTAEWYHNFKNNN